MVKFVIGSGNDRFVVPMAAKSEGPAYHEQRRAFKQHVGLLK